MGAVDSEIVYVTINPPDDFHTIVAPQVIDVTVNEAGSGEITTASNENTQGVGVYLTKVDNNLEFAGIAAKDAKITVEYDAPTKAILVGTSLPAIMTSDSAPPSPTGIPDGTIFLMYV